MIKNILSFLLIAGITQVAGITQATEEDYEGMARLIRAEFSSHPHLLNASEGRDIVAFFGNTGSGKSTLVNILAGIRLVADGPDYVLSNPDDPSAMAIGVGGESKTSYPQYIDVEGVRYFDFPGLDDTRGLEKDLVTAVFIHHLLANAKTIRPVFVVGEDEFTSSRGEAVKRILASIHKLIVGETKEGDEEDEAMVQRRREAESFLDDSLFIVSKSACGDRFSSLVDYGNYLLRSVSSAKDPNPMLMKRMTRWMGGEKFYYFTRPGMDLKGPRDHVKRLIHGARPQTTQFINISTMYPEKTLKLLENVSSAMMGDAFYRGIDYTKALANRTSGTASSRGISTSVGTPGAGAGSSVDALTAVAAVTTLTTYTQMIEDYEGYWGLFPEEAIRLVPALELLKEFSLSSYQKALKHFETDRDGERQAHISFLQKEKDRRFRTIEQTIERGAEKIKSLVPKRHDGIPTTAEFDNRVYQMVFGKILEEMYPDGVEQDVVRVRYRNLIVAYIQYLHDEKLKAAEAAAAAARSRYDSDSSDDGRIYYPL